MRGTFDFDTGNDTYELAAPEDDDHIFIAKYDQSGAYLRVNRLISNGT